MKTLPRLLVFGLLLIGTSITRADVRFDPPEKPKLRIVVDLGAKKPALLTPARPEGIRDVDPLDKKEESQTTRPRLWIVGAALTLAFITGGIWLVRKGTSHKILSLIVCAGLVTTVGAIAYADIPVPKKAKPKEQTLLFEGEFELSAKGDKSWTLVLDPKTFEKIQKAKLPE
ncbi:MAG: hypothetical protein N2112_16275 [Gemmataceae bacterium]|nr:hypothetical protein [Gemmataceae bacterium]